MVKSVVSKTMNIEYDLDYLVIVPVKDEELFESFTYTFKNTILFHNTIEDIEFLVKFLRKNIVRELVFVDYYGEYNEVIDTLIEEHPIKFIFTRSLGELSDRFIRADFDSILSFLKAKKIEEIGFLDKNLYLALSEKYDGIKYLMLDVERVEKGNGNSDNAKTVGVINSGGSDYDSFYNELSALTFCPDYRVKIWCNNKTTRDFVKQFKVECIKKDSLSDAMEGNLCNLDINFAGGRASVFLRSMDLGVPCIIGNNDFLPEDLPLSKELVVRSDDDVNEIRDKIKAVVAKRDEILGLYSQYRETYSKKSRLLAEEFVMAKIIDHVQESDVLLSVIVPVYNTAEYLGRCLESVLAARIPGMEILVINDGSTDNSEAVAKQYAQKYPNIIRYIEKENGGLGSVRNVGLREARGKYLASVDSDDTINPRFFKDSLSSMRDDVDMVVCDWMSIGKDDAFETPALDPVFGKEKVLAGMIYTTIMPSTCNKIMKKEIFDCHEIRYLEGKYEDLSANTAVFLLANSVKYIKAPYYDYYLRDNSLMRSRIRPREMVDAIAYLNRYLKVTRNNFDMDKFDYYTFAWRVEEYILNPLFELSGSELMDDIEYIDKNLGEFVKMIFQNKYYIEMCNKLKNGELRDFIMKRNEAIMRGELGCFVKKHMNTKYKLNAGIIYYGD